MHVGPGTKARRWAAVPFVAVFLVVDIVGRVLAAPSKGESVEGEATAPAVPGCSVQRLGIDCLERINDLGWSSLLLLVFQVFSARGSWCVPRAPLSMLRRALLRVLA